VTALNVREICGSIFCVIAVEAFRNLVRNKTVVAWIVMVTSIAVHILDEALTDFLPFYNQLVFDLRGRFQFLPLPTFSFGLWLGGLVLAVAVGFAITPIVDRGGRFIRIATGVLGLLMIANACGHMIGSVYVGRILPGFWSSPILLLAAVFVVVRAWSRSYWVR
jgi:hypothetical protein